MHVQDSGNLKMHQHGHLHASPQRVFLCVLKNTIKYKERQREKSYISSRFGMQANYINSSRGQHCDGRS